MKKMFGIILLTVFLLTGITVLAQNSNSSTTGMQSAPTNVNRGPGRRHHRRHHRWHRRHGRHGADSKNANTKH